MQPDAIAICSNPDCTDYVDVEVRSDLPDVCPTCSWPMLAQCWKCEASITDPSSSYCGRCGVPLKRVLPRVGRGMTLFAVCGNPECDWAVEVTVASTMPSRCPDCATPLVSRCWKCSARVLDVRQHYCQACGVPLKRQLRPA